MTIGIKSLLTTTSSEESAPVFSAILTSTPSTSTDTVIESSVEIVVIKGTFSGLGSLVVAFLVGEEIPAIQWLICVLVLGFVAYGLSIQFYVALIIMIISTYFMVKDTIELQHTHEHYA